MAQLRIFIAIDVSDAARRAATEYIAGLQRQFAEVGVGWERPEKLHFTLKFLGKVDEARLPEIENSIAAVAAKQRAFTAELSAAGVFPNPREPRVLWLGVGDGMAEILSLGSEVEDAMSSLGFSKADRPFRPHLTIGRVREPRFAKELAAAHTAGTVRHVAFAVDRLTIYESRLTQRGSTYRILSTQGFLR